MIRALRSGYCVEGGQLPTVGGSNQNQRFHRNLTSGNVVSNSGHCHRNSIAIIIALSIIINTDKTIELRIRIYTEYYY